MIYLIAVFFVIYNTILFSYSKKLYNSKIHLLPIVLITTPINFFVIYASIYFTEFKHDYLIMIAFIFVYSVEFLVFFKQSLLRALFGTLSYSINIFAMRAIVLAIIALYNQIPIVVAVDQLNVRLLVTASTLIIRPFTLLSAMKLVDTKQIQMIFNEKNNLLFAFGIMLITFVYQVFASLILNVQTYSTNAALFLLVSGIFAEAIYICAMTHTFEFSHLKEHMTDTERLKDEVQKEQERLEALKMKADIDPFTGLYIRKAAENQLMQNVAAKKEFTVVFVDIDGLKVTNDTYGHEEGDFYIKEVARLLLEHFPNEFIARLGGDEFVIISDSDEDSVSKKVLELYKASIEVAHNHKKNYETSISYGLQFVNNENTYSAKEILSIADKKMYEFKRQRKKERSGSGSND